jgi:DNA-binding SARP family transcriptional activator
MVLAKWALPFPSFVSPTQPVLEQALGGSMTLFAASPGYVLTSRLAGLLQELHVPSAWLRIGIEDRDPATLLMSLVNCLESTFPGIRKRSMEYMRRRPGPVYGWAPLFSTLARDVCDACGSSGNHPPIALVVQHVHMLYDSPTALLLLKDIFLPLLPACASRILTSHLTPPKGVLPGYGILRSEQELRLEESEALIMAQNSLISAQKSAGDGPLTFPLSSLRQLIALSDGCAEALAGMCMAYPIVGGPALKRLVESANSRVDLMARIARCWLRAAPWTISDMWTLALRLEYLDQATVQAALGTLPEEGFSLPPGWLQPLVGGWSRLRCVWQDPLRQVLRPVDNDNRQILHRAADHLIRTGVFEHSIPLLLDLEYSQEAAQAIQQVAESMMDCGQWETLTGWLARLPEAVRRDRPWLTYVEGELAAARGQSRAARHIFANTTRAFHRLGDEAGAGQSLLNESILAAQQNDLSRAEDFAKQAQVLAKQSGLSWLQGWAAWELACLAASTGKIEDAAAYLADAESIAIPNTRFVDLIGETRELVQAVLYMDQLASAHRQAAEEADQAGREAANRLGFFLQNPAGQADALLEHYGWSKVPLSIKLPGAYAPPGISRFEGAQNDLSGTGRLVKLVRSLLQLSRLANAAPDSPIPPSSAPSPPSTVALIPNSGVQYSAEMKPPPVSQPISDGVPVLNAYLLGKFRVTINGMVLSSWPSGRSRSLFAFLLAHHSEPEQRDQLIETFWSEFSSEAGRNNLNVAIYTLRQTLKNASDFPLIVLEENAYCINSKIQIWLDVDEFEQRVRAARQIELAAITAEDARASIAEYEAAVSLYHGDFLSDSPYEDWTALDRERLRVIYLDTLDHLSLVYFNFGEYEKSISLCQRMLSHDASREDAHCRLMRSFTRQGQLNLALRQYQACVEALRSEMDVDPAPATVQLFEQIRRREMV